MAKIMVVLAGLLLAGCVNADTQMTAKGNFPSYRSLLAAEVWDVTERSPYARTVPRPVLAAYSECSADYLMSNLTDAEKQRLDSYARHETTMSWNESRDIEREMRDRAGGDLTYETLDRLNGICPGDVPSFKEYLQPLFKPL